MTREVRLTLIGILLGLFLAALDQTIVATALPRIVEEFGDRTAPGVEILRPDLDHVVERDLPAVHTGEELDGDRHLVGRCHREALVPIQVHPPPGLEVNRRHAHRPAAPLREPLDLGQESGEAGVVGRVDHLGRRRTRGQSEHGEEGGEGT